MEATRFPYRPGDAKAECDICGFLYYHSQLRLNWKSQLVCSKDFEQRHPQDFVRGIKEKIAIDNPRPGSTDRFLAPGDVTQDDL